MTGVDVGMRRLGTPRKAAGFRGGKPERKKATANLWELLLPHTLPPPQLLTPLLALSSSHFILSTFKITFVNCIIYLQLVPSI